MKFKKNLIITMSILSILLSGCSKKNHNIDKTKTNEEINLEDTINKQNIGIICLHDLENGEHKYLFYDKTQVIICERNNLDISTIKYDNSSVNSNITIEYDSLYNNDYYILNDYKINYSQDKFDGMISINTKDVKIDDTMYTSQIKDIILIDNESFRVVNNKHELLSSRNNYESNKKLFDMNTIDFIEYLVINKIDVKDYYTLEELLEIKDSLENIDSKTLKKE